MRPLNPSDAQVHTIQAGGTPRLVSREAQPPTLTDLQYLVQGIDPKRAPPGLFQRMFGSRDEQEEGQSPPVQLRRGPAGVFAEPGIGDFGYPGTHLISGSVFIVYSRLRNL